jgi:hypothetical protein
LKFFTILISDKLVITLVDKSIDDPNLVEKIAIKGIKNYIAFEIQEDLVKEKYGKHFNVILGDLKQEDDLRVLDYDGHHCLKKEGNMDFEQKDHFQAMNKSFLKKI